MNLEKIRSLCAEAGISLAELERRTNIGNGVISQWENSFPRLDNAMKVADFFGVTIDELIRREE